MLGFHIRFNNVDPRHIKAAEILNNAGRNKATIIANALWEYKTIQKNIEKIHAERPITVTQASENESMGDIAPVLQEIAPAREAINPTLAKSVLTNMSAFKE